MFKLCGMENANLIPTWVQLNGGILLMPGRFVEVGVTLTILDDPRTDDLYFLGVAGGLRGCCERRRRVPPTPARSGRPSIPGTGRSTGALPSANSATGMAAVGVEQCPTRSTTRGGLACPTERRAAQPPVPLHPDTACRDSVQARAAASAWIHRLAGDDHSLQVERRRVGQFACSRRTTGDP